MAFTVLKPPTPGKPAGAKTVRMPGTIQSGGFKATTGSILAPPKVQTGPTRLAPGTAKPTALPPGLNAPGGALALPPPGTPQFQAAGQTPGTSATTQSPLDATALANIAENQFKVNNQINGLNQQSANDRIAMQNALGQLAYQQPRDSLQLEQAANNRGALYSTAYNQDLGNLQQQYATKQNAATDTNAQQQASIAAQIQALLGGVPLFNNQEAAASAARLLQQAEQNPATGQPAVPQQLTPQQVKYINAGMGIGQPPAAAPVSGTIQSGGPWVPTSGHVTIPKPPSKTPIRDPFAKKTGFSSTVRRVK